MFPIPELDAVDVVFPANVVSWMPSYGITRAAPLNPKWENIASRWFYSGLPKETNFVPKSGVDVRKALNALKACLGSFEPKHEHKMEAASYMMSEWFEDVTGWEAKAVEETV